MAAEPRISIHAPHARSDDEQVGLISAELISIHAPHARSDGMGEVYIVSQQYFNPRSSCEERPLVKAQTMESIDFNPRSSCEERPAWDEEWSWVQEFQSTLLMRGATPYHATNQRGKNFNPRSSCEERRIVAAKRSGRIEFQSTLLMRGATYRFFRAKQVMGFQSTLLMRGATYGNLTI